MSEGIVSGVPLLNTIIHKMKDKPSCDLLSVSLLYSRILARPLTSHDPGTNHGGTERV
jgi:hypothetical protein